MKRISGKRYGSQMLFVAAITLAVNLVFSSCGRGPDEEKVTTGIQSTVQEVICPDSVEAEITVKDKVFAPSTVSVPINGVVKWTNIEQRDYRYWVISDNVPGGSFKITAILPGQSACLRFTAPGTYLYHCDPDDGGKVIVQ